MIAKKNIIIGLCYLPVLIGVVLFRQGIASELREQLLRKIVVMLGICDKR